MRPRAFPRRSGGFRPKSRGMGDGTRCARLPGAMRYDPNVIAGLASELEAIRLSAFWLEKEFEAVAKKHKMRIVRRKRRK